MMTRVNLRLIAVLPALAALAVAGTAAADSKKNTFDACTQAVKKEFGESPVTFDKFRRDDTKGVAYGEMQLSDGSVRTIRCRLKGGQVLDMKFRNDGGGAGNFWTDDRPAAAIYVEPKPKDEAADGETAADGKAGETDKDAAGDEKPADEKSADGKDAGGGGGDAAGGDQKAADGDAAGGDEKAADGDAAGAGKTADADAAADADKVADGESAAEADKTAEDKTAEDKPADKDDGLVKPRFIKVPGN